MRGHKHIVKKEQHVCGECKKAEWVTDNPRHFTVEGHKPMCMRCYRRKNIFLHSEPACEFFEK